MDTGEAQRRTSAGEAFAPQAVLAAAARDPRLTAFRGPDGAISAMAERFLEQYGAQLGAELEQVAPLEAAAAMAHELFAWALARGHGGHVVRLRQAAGANGAPLALDALDVAGPDGPFLVESVMGEIAAQGLTPLAMAHPVVATSAGGALSTIQVLFERVGDAGGDRARALVEGVEATLADVRASVADYAALRQRMGECADELSVSRAPAPADSLAESVAFLRWLADNRFTFLGARDYRFARDAEGELVRDEPIILPKTGLGILRDPDRYVLRRGSEPSVITAAIERVMEDPTPIVISKSSFVSRVHRRVPADYIGVKRYAPDGRPVGETRFVGLFTSEAYNEPTRAIPLLRQKVARVRERTGAAPKSHNARALNNILETYPRDELFQIEEDELLATALAVLHTLDRPRPRLFVRRDRFDRFVSALAYVPRDRFGTALREAIGRVLVEAYGGQVAAFYPELGDGPLARIRFVVQDIDRDRPPPDVAALERAVTALTRTWQDEFEAAARAADDRRLQDKTEVARRYRDAFTAGYRERNTPEQAIADVAELQRLEDAPRAVRVRAEPAAEPAALRCKLYAADAPLPLSSMLPVLENMGFFVEHEVADAVRPSGGGRTFVVHEIAMRSADDRPIDLASVETPFEEAFAAIWSGRADNDGFNRLVLALGVSWREAALFRALARYRTQTGLDPAQSLQEQALAAEPEIARLILGLFRVRFDPALPEGLEERAAWAGQIRKQIEERLAKVASLDADRALRRIADLIGAIQRTNYYQPGPDGLVKPHLSFKIASGELEDLPEPKPYREIWVWSSEVEGVHLRFGPVARGGLRWSDRRDDFRAEVLDLVKAQQVKNSIIVPVGAKGGFYPKALPQREDRAAYAAAGQSAYRMFLRGLLDLTDNLDGERVVAPAQVVRWDGDDPYLVVAADKGTATFSDVANAISAEYGHWLGDAFASGGSVGYDHKAMGITAKGAWEAVKRHFRELGRDTQSEPFTVIGVGDMSGDVFGNGMLLSTKIRLVAAFDHRDIFIDPAPADLDRAWAERRRLFDMPGSRWRDYDAGLISAGGGVFARSEKAIALSPQMKALTGLGAAYATPAELIHALLKASCDLLWFGGIGAYVKAARESHAEVADKANDAIRVDAEDVRAKVIGEGANLGVTQAGRIAFARAGGRINTDAVDNSAGVDTSDHEVNIKILLAEAARTGALAPQERAPLLAAMTDDVARLVLRNNYNQTLALTLAEACAAQDLDAHERLIERLAAAGKLSRRVEGLPNAEGFRALRDQHKGLSRPELAKLIAYAKIDLFDALVASETPDDPHFLSALREYFPPQLARFEAAMTRHRLRREIVATNLAGWLVDVGGPTFAHRVAETTRAEPATIARAAEAARRIYALDDLRDRINALDLVAPAAAQTALHLELAALLRRATATLARAPVEPLAAVIARYCAPVGEVRAHLWDTATAVGARAMHARVERLTQAGAPEPLAREVASLPAAVAALDVVEIAAARAMAPVCALRLHRAVAEALGFDRIRVAAESLVLPQHWERLSVRRLLEELAQDHRRLTLAAAEHAPAGEVLTAETADAAARRWLEGVGPAADRARATMAELESAGDWSYAKVVLAAAELRGLSGGG